jgi:hypothetical protein
VVCWYSGSSEDAKDQSKRGSGACQYTYSNAQGGYATSVRGSFGAHDMTATTRVFGSRHGDKIEEGRAPEILKDYLQTQPSKKFPQDLTSN